MAQPMKKKVFIFSLILLISFKYAIARSSGIDPLPVYSIFIILPIGIIFCPLTIFLLRKKAYEKDWLTSIQGIFCGLFFLFGMLLAIFDHSTIGLVDNVLYGFLNLGFGYVCILLPLFQNGKSIRKDIKNQIKK